MPNLLVEIGVEELPVETLDVIYGEFAEKTRQKLVEEHIAFAEVKTEATPRRIALFVQGIATMQPDRKFEVPGPSHEKCYDTQGNPTLVLQGFLKSKKATEKDIEVRQTPKGKFIFLKKKEKGRAVAAILPDMIKSLLVSISFPKLMRWETSGFRFPRPIRWIVAVLDGKVIPLQIADVKSGNKSYGHRFLSPQGFTIPRADWKAYVALLKKKHVHLLLGAREAMVRGALKNRFGQKRIDEELAHMNAQLVEEPFFLQGTFSQEYLELPDEVLASCMKKNQKVFACHDAKEKMKNQFVAVMNGKRNGLAKIRSDYENVLDSRLKDARYFYEMDTKEPLEKRKSVLAQLVYLGKDSSMLNKVERLEKMAEIFANETNYKDLSQDLVRVASLSKNDLVTHLVYEIPDLQGIVGREYALEGGEKEEVALAIGAQYLPKSLTENYQDVKKSMNLQGALFGIIDRLDLLIVAFGKGIEPTGSQDPFALRRAGGIIVKLIRAFNIHFNLNRVAAKNLKLCGNLVSVATTERDISVFLRERFLFELKEVSTSKTSGKAGDVLGLVIKQREIANAVWETTFGEYGDSDIAEAFIRYDALIGMFKKDRKNFLKAAKVVERTGNIIRGTQKEIPDDVKKELFQDALESTIFQLYENNVTQIEKQIENHDYEQATLLLGKVFYEPLHDFFEKVMINVDDPIIRANRQALMKKINRLYTARIADLSTLSRIDEE